MGKLVKRGKEEGGGGGGLERRMEGGVIHYISTIQTPYQKDGWMMTGRRRRVMMRVIMLNYDGDDIVL